MDVFEREITHAWRLKTPKSSVEAIRYHLDAASVPNYMTRQDSSCVRAGSCWRPRSPSGSNEFRPEKTKAPVRRPRPRHCRDAGVAGLARKAFDGRVVEAEVEDRIHHPRHGSAGARTDRHEQRVGGVSELGADQLFDLADPLFDFGFQRVRVLLVVGVVVGADLGRDGEARRNGQSEIAHLCKISTLAPEEIAHSGLAFGPSVPKRIDPLRHRAVPFRRCEIVAVP